MIDRRFFEILTRKKVFTNILTVFTGGGERYEEIKRSLCFMLARDKMSFTTVKKEGFLRYSYTMNPQFKPPDPKTVASLIDDYYDRVKDVVIKNYLKDAPSINLTGDAWSDRAKQSYLGVTAHFIAADLRDKKRKLLKVCLGLVPLFDRHTADYLGGAITQILQEFGILDSQIFSMTTDQGADIKKAVSDRFAGTDVRQLFCYNHCLALILPAALKLCKDAETLIEKINKHCKKCKNSLNCAAHLGKLQDNDNVPKNLQLAYELSCTTRWNSVLYMLEKYQKLLKYFPAVIEKIPLNDRPDELGAAEKAALNELIQLLRPMESITRKLSGTRYATAALIIPYHAQMIEEIKKVQCESNTGKQFKKSLIQALQDRFKNNVESSSVLAISTILDPRFKKWAFTDDVLATQAVKKIDQMIKTKFAKTSNVPAEVGPQLPCSKTASKDFSLTSSLKERIQKKIQKQASNHQNVFDNPSDELYYQLNSYIKDAPIELPDLEEHAIETNVALEYWETVGKAQYPDLYPIFLKYHAVQATSVASESAFSIAGQIKCATRSSILPERMDKLLFLAGFPWEFWIHKTEDKGAQ